MVLGRNFDRQRVLVDRGLDIAALLVEHSEVEVGQGEVVLFVDRLLEERDCLGGSALLDPHLAELVGDKGVPRPGRSPFEASAASSNCFEFDVDVGDGDRGTDVGAAGVDDSVETDQRLLELLEIGVGGGESEE